MIDSLAKRGQFAKLKANREILEISKNLWWYRVNHHLNFLKKFITQSRCFSVSKNSDYKGSKIFSKILSLRIKFFENLIFRKKWVRKRCTRVHCENWLCGSNFSFWPPATCYFFQGHLLNANDTEKKVYAALKRDTLDLQFEVSSFSLFGQKWKKLVPLRQKFLIKFF